MSMIDSEPQFPVLPEVVDDLRSADETLPQQGSEGFGSCDSPRCRLVLPRAITVVMISDIVSVAEEIRLFFVDISKIEVASAQLLERSCR